mmetsp:Transcript_49422/g.139068  ORF Transcript_49422/g.139068 Transcript_49422/m.139068 type:complete len:223 (+) Transcript_49422:417-1085(+)
MPLHRVDCDLRHQEVLRLGGPLHPQATDDELLDGELPAVVVVEELEDLLGVVDGEVDHPQLVVDLGLGDGSRDLLVGERPALINVGILENLPQLVENELTVRFLGFPRLPLVFRGGGEGVLHNDADDDVQEAEGRDADQRQEEEDHAGLIPDDVPRHGVVPLVQGDNLKQREHRARNAGEVDLVIPAGLQEVAVVDLVVVPDPERGEDAPDVAQQRDHHADP